jgi:hypothetical protein
MTSLKSHSHSRRLTTQPDAKNVQRGIGVAIVRRTAIRTFPASYSKCAYTFRAAGRINPAARTHLGRKSLVGFGKQCPCLLAFIREHEPETRPARIGNGFSNPRPLKASRVHVANNDVTVLPHKVGRLLVQEILSSVRDLGVDSFSAPLVTRTLSYREGHFVLGEVLGVLDHAPVTERRKGFKPQVNADSWPDLRGSIPYLALEGNVPATTGVFHKASGLNLALKRAAVPVMILASEQQNMPVSTLRRVSAERYPAERSSAAKTRAKSWAPTSGIARLSELHANHIDCLCVEAKIFRRARRQIYKIKCGRPPAFSASAPASFCFPLSSGAEIPDLITGSRVTKQIPATTRVFDPIFERDNHEVDSTGPRAPNQSKGVRP